MIDDIQSQAINNFLQTYYGQKFDYIEITPLKGGIATSVFKVNLRLNTEQICVVVRKNPEQSKLRDFRRESLFQDYCSDTEIGPKTLYRDENYTLMKFIPGSWPVLPNVGESDLSSIAKSIRVFHSADVKLDLPENHFIFELKQMLNISNIEPEKEKILLIARDWLNKVAGFYYKKENLCSCHLDLNPSNILLNQNTAFLIDFTDAHFDDRFIDLGKFSAYMGLDTSEKKRFLKSYFTQDKVSEKQTALLNIAQMIFELRLGIVGLLNIKIDADQLNILLSKQDDFSLAEWQVEHSSLVHDYLNGKLEDQNNFFKRLIQVFYQSWQQKIDSKEHVVDLTILSSPSYQNFFPPNIPTFLGNQTNPSQDNTYNQM